MRAAISHGKHDVRVEDVAEPAPPAAEEAVVRQPVAVIGEQSGDLIARRSMGYLSISLDHGLVVRADAVRFAGSLKGRLDTLETSWADARGLQEDTA